MDSASGLQSHAVSKALSVVAPDISILEGQDCQKFFIHSNMP